MGSAPAPREPSQRGLALRALEGAQRRQSRRVGRSGLPDEVADAVVFLSSPMASYINGAVLEVTGGRGI